MRLRYAGVCRECGTCIGQGDAAIYDKSARNVICLPCGEGVLRAGQTVSTESRTAGEPHPSGPSSAPPTPVEIGTAGASARREFERRAAQREQRIRARHPKLGGLILALSDDPQSTTAWRTGARGEEVLGSRLNDLAADGVRVLHDRRIPKSRANIDHIAISGSGVYVPDAKRYQGRPTLRVEGGLLRPRTETLMVGGRRCNPLVEGMHKQLGLVQAIIGHDVPLAGMLVFIEADWPLIGGDFVTRQVRVLWVKKAIEHILLPGPLTADQVDGLHRKLAAALPSA